jgi:serine/threonine protein kinase
LVAFDLARIGLTSERPELVFLAVLCVGVEPYTELLNPLTGSLNINDKGFALQIRQFALDDVPARLARFRREARALASLNHPNIAAIYGLEESGEVDCLVLEFGGGRTFAWPASRSPRTRSCAAGGRGAGSRAC